MTDAVSVDGQQIRSHVSNLDGLRDRVAAIRSASASIAQDDEAYGLLCGWMSGILERRHQAQEQFFAQVAENLSLAGDALIQTADDYDEADSEAADGVRQAGGR
ncbi:type VII secretion target [Actinoplanes sp. NPDC051470]|uniref:type VII secretion target n=1 Tax=unclassified Actinoplanes TaxID=2626549 RepID=UPI00342F646A